MDTRLAFVRAFSTKVFPGKELSQLSPVEWLDLINKLERFKVFLPLSETLYEKVNYQIVRDAIQAKRHVFQNVYKLIINELVVFAKKGLDAKLSFTAIKGAPLAQMVYGSKYARHYSDIDILVSEDDISKADWVAKECGFIQPSEYYVFRSEWKRNRASINLNDFAAPYITDNRIDTGHVSPYVKKVGRSLIVLEIHSRICDLTARTSSLFLWDTEAIKLNGQAIKVPSRRSLAALLVLFAYEDSEPIFSNLLKLDLGLKYYVDLAFVLNSTVSQSTKENLERFIGQLGASNQLKTVFNNLNDFLSLHSNPIARPAAELSIWQDDYPTRVFNLEKRRGAANRAIRTWLESCAGEASVGKEHVKRWVVAKREIAQCCMTITGKGLHLHWAISEALRPGIDSYVFQVRLFSFMEDDGICEIRANTFLANNRFETYAEHSSSFSRSGKASKSTEGLRCDCQAIEDEKNLHIDTIIPLFEIEVDIPSFSSIHSLRLHAAIYKNHILSIFHEVLKDCSTMDGKPELSMNAFFKSAYPSADEQ